MVIFANIILIGLRVNGFIHMTVRQISTPSINYNIDSSFASTKKIWYTGGYLLYLTQRDTEEIIFLFFLEALCMASRIIEEVRHDKDHF